MRPTPTPSPSRGLRVEGATVRYGAGDTAPGITEVTLSVAPREIVAILGPSGSGKSTLLRAIAGLEPLTSGAVHWEAENLTAWPPHRRGFGLMFQDAQLFPHLTVAGNVGYGLPSRRSHRAQRDRRIAELLAMVGLPDAGPRAVTELSGGEQQRIALARSLAPAPRLLMLDEPLSSLDRDLRDRLAADLARVVRETGTTALLVTHDEREAAAISDRIVRLRDGRLDGGDAQ